MDESKTSMASTSSDDSYASVPYPNLENIKREKSESPLPNSFCESMSAHQNSGFPFQSSKEKPRTKRTYNKKQKILDNVINSIEKPPPKKRGRKSKKELLMMGKKSELAQELQPTFKKTKVKSPSHQKPLKSSKKSSIPKVRKSSGGSTGASVFDKKLLAGPHLTMKQVLEYILTDHSYCVPPDPLPAVGSNHQMIRYILGPKNGAKAKSLSTIGLLEPGDRSPIGYSSLSRTRIPLSMSSTPPPSSKLENLLKRGDSSPLSLSSSLRFSHSKHASDREESDLDIDVESVDPEPEKRVAYDVQKAKEVMNECEKYVEFARGADTGDNWEAKIVRTGWTKAQSSLFDKVVSALHAERLARLTFESAGDTEPVMRRTSLDRTATRIRRIFGENLWDTKLTQWLHSVLTEYLNFAYLAIYMDVLQTLKSQCPHLISRMMKLSIITPLQSAYGRDNELQQLLSPYLEAEAQKAEAPHFLMEEMTSVDEEKDPLASSTGTGTSDENSQSRTVEPDIYLPAKSIVPQVEDAMLQLHSAKNAEAFKTLLERQWDPFSPDLLQRLKRLSANPIFLVIAPGAIFPKSSLNARLKQYYRMFNRIGKIVKVCVSIRGGSEPISPTNYLDKIIYLAKLKMKEVRHCFPDRPLYLVGWGSGSILAARLSATAGPVDGIVALGFPLHSLREMHDDVLKIFGGIKHPILFVIGGLASNNNLTDMELFRRRLPCETSLVVVGAGNENLYVARDHREKLYITQLYVNKTVMDEVAYFVNLHSKHNQIIAANISMKPQFSKSQASSDHLSSRKPTSLSRGKKRKSSFRDLESETFTGSNNGDSNDSYDNDVEKHYDNSSTSASPNLHSIKRDVDAMKPPSSGSFDYGFDGPKFIPSNKSFNKRKAYYRPDTASTSSSVTSSSCITASKLLQQSPNAKRRMSKPSGPTQRVPLLNQQPAQRSNSGQVLDVPKDDAAALYKYLSSNSVNSQDPEQTHSTSSTFPLVLRDGLFQSEDNRSAPPYSSKDVNVDKTNKRKSSTKSKSARPPKTLNSSSESPTSSIISGLSEITPSTSSIITSTPSSSSLDIHKYVMQQQTLRQFEQTHSERPHTSQLFKLLSPGSESLDKVNLSSMATSASNISQGSTELVKLKLIGSQTGPSEVTGETRTAVISKQNLVSNMSLPMIRLSRPGVTEETSQQKPLFVTGASTAGGAILANFTSDSSEKILLTTSDKSVMKLNAQDLKNLIAAGGRGIQLFTGLPSQGPVNIIVKKQEMMEPDSSLSLVSVSNPTASSESTVAVASSTPHQFPTPSMIIPISDTTKSFGAIQMPNIPPVEAPNSTAVYESPVPREEAKCVESSTDQVLETEAMDIDPEEEMSGLLISSTFSVCPTSGERVLPSSTAASSNATDSTPAASATNIDNSCKSAHEEHLSVPVHVQSPNKIATEGNLTSTTTEICKVGEIPCSDQKIIPDLKETTAETSVGKKKKSTKKKTKSSNSVKSINVPECTAKPENVIGSPDLDTLVNKLTPSPVPINQPSKAVVGECSDLKKSSSHEDIAKSLPKTTTTTSNVGDSETTAIGISSEDKVISENIMVPASAALVSTDVSGCTNETDGVGSSSDSDKLLTEELLTVPIQAIQVESPNNSATELSTSDTNKDVESNETTPSTNEDDKCVSEESKASSATTSDEEKKKSKNNPVRRSARLKSGV